MGIAGEWQIGEWHFEVVRIKCRKVKKYGQPYTATVDINKADGEAHVEGLISQGEFTSADKEIILDCIKRLGFKYYISSHFNAKGERVINKIKLR
jgi:hypothetical protein